ncbi:monoamine oxidase [Rhodopirellula sp. JC740]|uniref:Monoamine oxidase n=1 Tax=Rhodopirellula halodulae TaxID=2894198 RepID=A0ABS8NEH7_9BACT|nr:MULTISPECIES: MaoC/PaaZ C-terminal domain-containing protein [unclassified Rhodopirellula]MCC9641948.1 monoamine oxidase [Rhodopirellula sp. JC740]MCC9658445.1 monoamine oxidase [Rhodopirellula sp. JC737]
MSDSMPTQNPIVSPEDVTRPETVVIAKDVAEPTDLLYCEDLEIGMQWLSPWRTISADDVRAFSELTGDYDPLHNENGKESPLPRSPFGRPVAHGLLGLSVLAGLSTEHPRAATLALVSVSDWNFENPVFFGERVRVRTTVESSEPHGRRAAKITWHRQLISDDGRTLQQGKFVTLVASNKRYLRQPK